MIDGFLGYSQQDWLRAANTTLAQTIRELQDATLRNYQMGALLMQGGRFLGMQRGRGIDWEVKYRNHPVEGNTGQTERNFARINLYKKAYAEYRGYQATDAMFEEEFLANGAGETQIIDVFDGMVRRIEQSVDAFMGGQYYIDGDDADNLQFWQGIDTIFKFAGTINSSTGAARTANTGDFVAYPYGTYAGIEMELGEYQGSNQTGYVWPAGLSDPQYDFWSPLGVMLDNTTFTGGSTPTYDAVRWGLTHADRNRSQKGQITNIMADRERFRLLKEEADTKERIIVTSEVGLRALGFRDTINFDGREVSWEVAIAPDTLYGFNYQNIEMRSRYAKLMESEGPFYDHYTQAYNAVVKSRSNMRYESPRNFVKWMKTTAVPAAPA